MNSMTECPKFVELEDADCPLGCIRNDQHLFKGLDRLHGLPGVFTVVKCKTCGLIRTNPRPTAQTIGYYYPSEYAPFLSSKVTKAKHKSFYHKVRAAILGKVFNTYERCIPAMPTGSMLEIGCASGSFLSEMERKGWIVEGVEFSEQAARSAIENGFNVKIGALENVSLADSKYDLIAGWMVLEHLHDPILSLKKLHSCANNGAFLTLSVPNASTLGFRLFQGDYYATQIPTHLYHFTPSTVQRILAASGWKVIRVFNQRNSNNLLRSLAIKMDDAGLHNISRWLINLVKSRYSLYFLFPLSLLLSVCGQSGRMTIWAKKDK